MISLTELIQKIEDENENELKESKQSVERTKPKDLPDDYESPTPVYDSPEIDTIGRTLSVYSCNIF